VSQRTRTLPVIEPILVERRADPFNHSDWVFEPKYDGYRGVLYLAPGVATFGSKRGNVLTRFRLLAEAIHAQLGVRNAILDGEVVALDDEGRQDFGLLLRSEGRLHYAAFDLLWLNGRDLRALPLVKRQQRLARLIRKATSILSRVLVVEEDGRALFQAVQRLDLEGIVAKRKADPYSPDVNWLKIKNPAYTQAEGRWELFQKRRGSPS
jgi:bifunctional non-homologous end joining protein LigD